MSYAVSASSESYGDTKYGDFLEALEKLKLAGAKRIVISPPHPR